MFISKEEFIKLRDAQDESFINEILMRVYNKAIEDSLALLPRTLVAYTKKQTEIANLISDFYKNNKEFIEHKQIVTKVVGEIEKENPGLTYSFILSKATPIIRNKIELLNKEGGK